MKEKEKQISDNDTAPKTYKHPKWSSGKFVMSDLVIKQVNILGFMKMLQLISAN